MAAVPSTATAGGGRGGGEKVGYEGSAEGSANDRVIRAQTKIRVTTDGGSRPSTGTLTPTVNLPTWIWLDKAKFKKLSVTASLPGTGLSATTTAEPVSLHIEPGTADAQTYPASGECAINADGNIGAPYAGRSAGRARTARAATSRTAHSVRPRT